MATDEVERERREKKAREAIEASLGTEAGEYGATLFVTHHAEELDGAYWQSHLGTTSPAPRQVLGLLLLKAHRSGEDPDGLDTLDFGLPGDVSNYLLSVRFDARGEVEGISMES